MDENICQYSPTLFTFGTAMLKSPVDVDDVLSGDEGDADDMFVQVVRVRDYAVHRSAAPVFSLPADELLPLDSLVMGML